MIEIVIFTIIISMALISYYFVMRHSIFDRMLAVNSFGTNVVVMIVLLGIFFETEFLVDIALIYALINFLATIAFLRYFEHKPI